MAGKTHITEEQWQQEVQRLGNGSFEVLDAYAGSNTAIQFKHSCGHVFSKTPHDWKRHPTCPACTPPGRKAGFIYQPKLSKEDVQAALDTIHGNGEITIVSDYTTTANLTTFRHTCGHVWEARPNNLLRASSPTGCPACSNRKRKLTHEEFLQRCSELPDADQYEVVGTYVGAHKGVDIVHVACGQLFRPSPINFFAGTRCPSCSSATNSSHVRAVATGLESVLPFFGISEYAKEHAFPDGPVTPNGSPLRFDIWIEELQLAIEVDGEFHDRPHYADPHPEETMQRLRASEQLRHQYAEHAGFRLARIRWDEKDLACRAIQIVLDRAKELEYVAFADFAASA